MTEIRIDRHYICKKCGEETSNFLLHVREKHGEQEYHKLVNALRELEVEEQELERIWDEKGRLKAKINKIDAEIADHIDKIAWS